MTVELQSTSQNVTAVLEHLRTDMQHELLSITSYWKKWMPNGEGFHASLNNDNQPDPAASSGLVLHARILWAFSAVYGFTHDPGDLQMAVKAYRYIIHHFRDKEAGGMYWSLDQQGQVLHDRKQIYGQAFCIYGFAEFYKQTGDVAVLNHARELYQLIERHSYDPVNGGYIEAFTRFWLPVDDLRLSEKDNNDRKTANTHLHIVEAYANLYTVWPDEGLKQRIVRLLDLFDRHFIGKDGHLVLFFSDEWRKQSALQSYGHDIEGAWLLLQCAQRINDAETMNRFKTQSLALVNASIEGLDPDGGLWYEKEEEDVEPVAEKHWWPQAEAMIGFFHAWQLSGDSHYLEHCYQTWEFVKAYILDRQNGEWFWGVYADYSQMAKEKAGFWKCPYHNVRACIELINRIDVIKHEK